MSVASCSYQCTWVPDGGTITCSLLGSTGDLYQRFGGTAVSPTGISPDWNGTAAGSGPFIRIVLMENSPDISEADIAGCISDEDTKWYIDGLLLKFDSSGISINGAAGECQGYAGCFRKLKAAAGPQHIAGAPYGGLEIRQNLVTASNGHNIVVKAVVALTVDSKAVNAQGDTVIRMVKSVGTANFASIYCDSTDSFILDEKDGSVVCKVRCWQGDTELATGKFTRKWFLLEAGAWVQKSTADTFTVDRDMIDTFGDVKVECWSKDSTPAKIASDIQTVADSTDAYVLSPCPDPADGQFYQTGGPEKIRFTPKVTDKDGNSVQVSGFVFVVMDSAGNLQPILPGAATSVNVSPGSYLDLLRENAERINEGPVVNITAVD